MAGVKRPRGGSKEDMDPISESPYHAQFDYMRSELDEHHDRRERVVRGSRDITATSKKIIFALQRTRDFGKPIHPSILKQTAPMLDMIRSLFESLTPDLQGLDAYRYQRNVSLGIQEYMEAVLFQSYLETHQLITYDEATATLPPGIMLTYEDYALGLFDMTGELMRFAITYIATNGYQPRSEEDQKAQILLSDMQALRTQLELLNASGNHYLSKDFEQKLKTTKNSVEKVENSVYSVIVRGSERPKGWRPDVSSMEAPKDNEGIEAS